MSHVDEFLKHDLCTTLIDKYYVKTCDIDYINGGLFMSHFTVLRAYQLYTVRPNDRRGKTKHEAVYKNTVAFLFTILVTEQIDYIVIGSPYKLLGLAE